MTSFMFAAFSIGTLAAGCVDVSGLETDADPAPEAEHASALGTSGTFAVATSTAAVHNTTAAIPLTDGRVLLTSNNLNFADAKVDEIYDPSTRVWSKTGVAPNTHLSVAARLGNGQVLALGPIFWGGSSYHNQTDLYAPSTNAWTNAGATSFGHDGGRAVTLQNGKVLLAGGGATELFLDGTVTEIYDPALAGTNKWRTTGGMRDTRTGFGMVVLQNGKVLVAGGHDWVWGSFAPLGAELYDPATGRWTPTGNLNQPHEWADAVLLRDGRVLLYGDDFSTAAEIYNPATGTWTVTGAPSTRRSHASLTLLASGKVLLAGGHDANGALASAELYDPATGTWSMTGPMHAPRIRPASVTLGSGDVLVAGGVASQPGCDAKCVELFTP